MTTALDYWPVIVELTMPSTNLVNYVCTAFEILKFVDDLITKSDLPVRKATECIWFIVSGHSSHLLVQHMKQLHKKLQIPLQ